MWNTVLHCVHCRDLILAEYPCSRGQVSLALPLPSAPAPLPPPPGPDYPSIPFYFTGSDSPPIRRQDGEEYDSGLACGGGEGEEQLSHSLTTAACCEMSEWAKETERIHSSNFFLSSIYFSLFLASSLLASCTSVILPFPESPMRTCSVSKTVPSLPRLSVCIWLLTLLLTATLNRALLGLQSSHTHTHTKGWCGSQGRLGWFMAEGNKLHTVLHMPTHKCICARTHKRLSSGWTGSLCWPTSSLSLRGKHWAHSHST